MNRTLYFSMLKANARSIFSYSIGSALYLWLIIWVYPSIANAKGIQKMMKQLPEGLLEAFNVSTSFNSVGQFVSNEFYGLLFLIILAIFSIVTANQLIARLVDRGSMAYLLATPNSRVKIAITQMLVLLSGLVIIVLFTTFGGILGAEWLLKERMAIDAGKFVTLNVLGFLLFFIISGYSFLFSCLFNDEKRAVGLSTLLTLLFFIFNLVGKMSADLSWLKNMSVFTLYNPQKIMSGEADTTMLILSLCVTGFVLYGAAILLFRRRDLPL